MSVVVEDWRVPRPGGGAGETGAEDDFWPGLGDASEVLFSWHVETPARCASGVMSAWELAVAAVETELQAAGGTGEVWLCRPVCSPDRVYVYGPRVGSASADAATGGVVWADAPKEGAGS